MKLYQLTDWDEIDVWFPSKREALKAFNEEKQSADVLEIVEVETFPLTKHLACQLIMRQGFAITQTTIKRYDKDRIEDVD